MSRVLCRTSNIYAFINSRWQHTVMIYDFHKLMNTQYSCKLPAYPATFACEIAHTKFAMAFAD